ncbi:MAG: N-acetyltransferase [Chloroflexia bacterium]|nr:N-acetyltransferase [Chloroflexia bacterium]
MTGEPPLETGWLPTTSDGDTLLRRYLLNLADSTAAITRSLGGRERRDERFALADAGRPAGFASSGLLLQPVVDDAVAETLAEVAHFYGFGSDEVRGEVTLFSPWPTPDLRPHGWHLVGHPPLHLLPAGAVAPPPPAGLRIERVADEETLARWERVAVAAYPFRDLRGFGRGALLGEGILADDCHRLWLGSVGETDLAAAQAHLAHGLTDVLLVATLRQARRQGYGAAMTWAAVTAEPEQPTMLLSSDDGRPVYDRMGFLPLSRWTLWYRYR